MSQKHLVQLHNVREPNNKHLQPSLKNPVIYGFWNDLFNISFTAGHRDSVRVDRLYLMMDYNTGPAIPEPATMVLVGLGLLGMGAKLRKRSK